MASSSGGVYQHLEIGSNEDFDVEPGNNSSNRTGCCYCSSAASPVATPLSSLGISTPSDPSRRWAVFLFALTTILLYADQNLLGPNLTAAANEFGFTAEERDRKLGGDIALAFFLLGAPASLMVGCLADTSHRSILFAVVVGIGEGACLLTYFSTTYTQLYACRAITGFSVGGAMPLIYSVLGDLFSSNERHAVTAIVGVGTGTGISLGQGLAGFLGPTFGWRLPFLVVSVPALVCALLVLLTVRDPERGSMEKVVMERREISYHLHSAVHLDSHKNQTPCSIENARQQQSTTVLDEEDPEPVVIQSHSNLSEERQQIDQGQTITNQGESTYEVRPFSFEFRVHWNTFVNLVSTPSVLLFLLQGAPGCVPWGIINTYLNDFLSEDRVMTVEGATATVLCFGAGSFCGLLVGGAGGQALYHMDPRYPSILAGAAAIFGCIPFWLVLNTIDVTSSFFYIIIVTGCAGLCAGITGPIVKANLQNVTLPTARGQAFAIYNTFDDFGRGLGPLFISIMISKFGGRIRAFNIGVLGWILCGIFNLLSFFTIEKDEEKMQRTLEADLTKLDKHNVGYIDQSSLEMTHLNIPVGGVMEESVKDDENISDDSMKSALKKRLVLFPVLPMVSFS